MLDVIVDETMDCTPDEFLEFVMDVERYAEVDTKIASIDWIRRDGNILDFKFRPALPGIPVTAPKMVLRLVLTPGKRIDLSLTPLPHNKLNHRLMKYTGSFVCEPVENGTLVKSVTSFEISLPAKWLMEPIPAKHLPPDVEGEMKRAKSYLKQHSKRS